MQGIYYNSYFYCANNSINNVDESGYDFKSNIWSLLKKLGTKTWSLLKKIPSIFYKPGKINLKPFEIVIDLLVGVVLPWLVKPLKVLSKVLTSYKAFNSKLVEISFRSAGKGIVQFVQKLGFKISLNTIFSFVVNNMIFKYLSRFLTIGGIICFIFDRLDGEIDYWWKYK